ncbi:dentin sialophosphoprotein-like isoform X2 [Sebastes umbrosus]|uniref:dentin sialophosphoprotein-like isoform X2 n=1 Tax=Sebastes umbrosus TaxID=72105 RepID=UPI00189EB089|nr:dentin sialophosphoprotein-like isoform X2 [Sebastes umbrosus]
MSNLKNNTGLQQRRHLNCASLACTSSAALKGVAAKIFPLQDQCSSVTVSKKQASNPLLVALLNGNPSDSKSFTTPSFLSEEINGNTELNTIPHFSDARHRKGQQVKSSQAALNCRLTRTQNPDHSRGTPSSPHQQQVFPPSLSSQSSTHKVLPVGETEPPTDAEIYDFIERKIAYFMTVLTQKERNYEHNAWDGDSTLQSDDTMPNSIAHLPTTSAFDKDVERQSLNCTVIEECTAAVGQALEEDCSKDTKANAELMPKFKETDDCVTYASMKHSTGTLVSAVGNSKHACESEFVKKSASVDFDLTVKKNLDATMPANGYCKLVYSDDCGKSFELASLVENQDANTKKRKNVDEHCGVTCEEAIPYSELDSPVDKIQITNIVSIAANQSEWLSDQTSDEGAREDAGSVHSQTDLCIALYENKVKEHATQSEREGEEARPKYEDISDDDPSQLITTVANTEHGGLSIPAWIKDSQYENVSDADNPKNEYMTVETSQVPEPRDEQSPLENEGYGHVQGQAQIKTEILTDEEAIPKQQVSLKTETLEIAQHCSSCFVEPDYGFEDLSNPKCNRETQTNHFVSNIPSFVLKAEDETDDEMDYDCLDISVLDLKFEPEDEDQDSLEKSVLEVGETEDEERQCDTSPTPPKPVLAFDFPQLPVYDTKESFIQAVTCRFEVASGESTPEHEMVSEEAQNRRQSVDSCVTEDSCDYSSASEHNYLTVSRKMLKKRSAPRPSKTDVSASEKEGEGDEFANMQKGQTRSFDKSGCMQKLRRLIEARAGCSKDVQPETNGQQISTKDDVIVIVSDTEDEGDHYCKRAKRKRKEKRILFSSASEDSGDAPCSQQKRHSPGTVGRQCGTVKEKLPENRLPSADSSAPQHRSNHDTPTEEMLQDASSDLSHSAGQIKTKAASEHVEGVINVDSDTEDDNDQKYKKPRRMRFFSSDSDSGDAPCVEPETRLSSADSSLPQRQSKLHDTQLKDVMPDACSDLSHNRKKSGLPIEAKSGSADVRHKADRQTVSKKRVVFHDSVVEEGHFSKKKEDKKGISSGSGDSSGDLFATKSRRSTETVDRLCGTANKKPKRKRLSSEDSEQQPWSLDMEVHSTLGSNPVIPRYIVKCSPSNTSLILLKEPRVHRRGKDGTRSSQTSTASSKKTDSREKNKAPLHRNKPVNDRHHATKHNVQANVPKPRISRQLSSHRQEGPSTSFSSLSSTSSASSRGLSSSGETSASSSLPSSKQSTSIPRQYLPLSKLQRSHSYGSPSTSSSATMPLSAKEQLNKDWKDSFFPTKRDKKHSVRIEEDFKATNDTLWEVRPGPSPHDKTPRQRHKSEPPLLKKIKIVALQRTKDINRDAPKQRCTVGEGYKWSKKPTVAMPTKGSSREGKKCRSPPRPHR